MKSILNIAIIIVALGCYAFQPAENQRKGGEMIVILDGKVPLMLEFRACPYTTSSPKHLLVKDQEGRFVSDAWTSSNEITISTRSFSPGTYTLVLGMEGCEEEAEVEILP